MEITKEYFDLKFENLDTRLQTIDNRLNTLNGKVAEHEKSFQDIHIQVAQRQLNCPQNETISTLKQEYYKNKTLTDYLQENSRKQTKRLITAMSLATGLASLLTFIITHLL